MSNSEPLSVTITYPMTLWVSEDRCTLFRWFPQEGIAEVATRPDPDAVWGPPIAMVREQTV